MNLKDLFTATPVANHGDILVVSDHVYAKAANGVVSEYLLRYDGELFALPTTATKVELDQLKTNLSAVDNKLAAAIETVRKDVAAIKAKVGAGPVA